MGLRELLNGTSAAPAPAAAAAPIETAARAAAATTAALAPAGNPELDLANLLAGFEANMGKAPQVNPPEAAKVLATKTALEVAGVREPEEEDTGPAVELPTSKPADVLAAESATRPRRTAAVVQAELDELSREHDTLVAVHAALKAEVASYADKVREEFAAEAAVGAADLEKAYARAESLSVELEAQKALNARALAAIQALQAQKAELSADWNVTEKARAEMAASGPAKPLSEYHPRELCKALQEQGFVPTLTVEP